MTNGMLDEKSDEVQKLLQVEKIYPLLPFEKSSLAYDDREPFFH